MLMSIIVDAEGYDEANAILFDWRPQAVIAAEQAVAAAAEWGGQVIR